MSLIVATLTGCAADQLNDPARFEEALRRAVAAGGFQLLHCYSHAFEPQGVTAAAVLSESHIALHSWPEEGSLFIDIATCSGTEATERAFRAICEHFAHCGVHWHQAHRPQAAQPLMEPAKAAR